MILDSRTLMQWVWPLLRGALNQVKRFLNFVEEAHVEVAVDQGRVGDVKLIEKYDGAS